MHGFRLGRVAISTACAVALALPTPVVLAQSTAPPPPPPQVCGIQAVHNPNCHVPPASSSVPIPPSGRGRGDNDGGDDRGGGGLGLLEVLGIIGGVVAAVLIAKALTGSKDASVRDLEAEGPQTPNQELLGQYEVQGLVHGGWPLVVEVAADPEATTFVQIVTADGKKDAIPPLVISDAGGRPWGDDAVLFPTELERSERGILARFELPRDLGRGGRDGFHSARLSVLSGRMQDREFAYRPLDVLALGAGPSAVGSAAVVISRFAPAQQARRADYEVTFNARRTFTNLRAELVRREADRGATTRTRIGSQDICRRRPGLDLCEDAPPSVPFPIDGSWPADAGEELGAGRSYHMELRAYTGRIRSGGWLVSQAPQVVTWP